MIAVNFTFKSAFVDLFVARIANPRYRDLFFGDFFNFLVTALG